MKYCPLTKEIAFARLGKRIGEKDKNAILKAKDLFEFYFMLGRIQKTKIIIIHLENLFGIIWVYAISHRNSLLYRKE